MKNLFKVLQTASQLYLIAFINKVRKMIPGLNLLWHLHFSLWRILNIEIFLHDIQQMPITKKACWIDLYSIRKWTTILPYSKTIQSMKQTNCSNI